MVSDTTTLLSRTPKKKNIKAYHFRVPKLIAKMRTTIHMYSPPATAIPTPKAIMARSHSKRSYPSLAFFSSTSGSYAMDIPLKATPSPPSCSSSTSSSYSDSDFLVRSNSSSLSSSPSSISSSGSFNSVSHPDWPQSDTLSSQPASYSTGYGNQKSCYISDEDLEDLASLPLWNDVRIPDHYVVSGYGNAQLTADAYGDQELPPTSLPTKPRKPMKSAGGKRRRSKELRRKPLGIMTPISESGE